MQVVGLAIFPVKGARGIALESALVESRGLAGDRRWMAIDPAGRAVTQRELPALARLIVEPSAAGLSLSLDGEAIEVAVPGREGRRIVVSLWADSLALPEAPAAGPWLTRRFGLPLRLVHLPDDTPRPVAGSWAGVDDIVSLADGFPILVATMASLAAVATALGAPLGMERFRPNLVIDANAPWEEDGWARLRIGEVELELTKPCARCSVTTVDQQRGRFAGEEPLAALRHIRFSLDRRVPGVLFGWNALPRRLGTLRVGDPVEVLEEKRRWPIRRSA